MESKEQFRIFTIFISFLFLATLFSCSSETSESSEKINDSATSSEPTIFEELVVEGDNKSSYYLDNEVVSPKKTEGHVKTENGIRKYTVLSYSGTEGYFFELSLAEGENLKGEHSMNKEGNRLYLNHKVDNMLTVYGSNFCQGNPGSIFVDEHDESAGTISGHFTVNVCNDGKMGQLGQKTLHQCKFNKVKISEMYNK